MGKERRERVRPGVERVCADPALLGRARAVGLLTNDRAVLPDLTSSVAALRDSGMPVTALLTPEHGLTGSVQAGFSEGDGTDPETGLPIVDTYGVAEEELDARLLGSGIDTVVVDLPDIGSRFYTYVWSLYDVLAAAARTGIRVVVLDRPNPLSGAVCEGPLLQRGFDSFVGRLPVPVRHGLTIGELALLAQRSLGGDVDVVAAEGWSRTAYADATGLPWVMPSVNVPTLDSALVYPGTCLFEGTNASEGRGTTRPFELVGAPYVDARWREAIAAADLPGVAVRDAWFVPTFHKHAGERVRGVQLHVLDRDRFAPVRTGATMLALLAQLYPEHFRWHRADAAAGGEAGQPFVDLLWGSPTLREAVDAGEPVEPLLGRPTDPSAWLGTTASCLLYT